MKLGVLTVILLGVLSCSQTAYKDSIQRELNYVNAIPFVKNISPSANNTDVDVNATIVVDFGSAMNISTTAGAFSLNGPTGSIAGSITWQNGNATLLFTPSNNLAYKTSYTITITSSAKTQFGTAMPTAFSASFMTNGNVYVTTTGNNATGDGTKPKPYLTIQYAIDQAKAKAASDVLVGAGDYNEQITMRRNVSLRGGYHPTTWAREWNLYVSRIYFTNPLTPLIDLPQAEGINSSSFIEGLTLEIQSSSGPAVITGYNARPNIQNNRLISNGELIRFNGLSEPLISSNTFQGTLAITLFGGNSVIRKNQINCGAGIQILGAGFTKIESNIFMLNGITTSGIIVTNSSGIIINNIIFFTQLFSPDQQGISLTANGGFFFIASNLIYSRTSGQVFAFMWWDQNSNSGYFFYNNIIYFESTPANKYHIYAPDSSGTHPIENNVFRGSTNYFYTPSAGQITSLAGFGANNLSVEPVFQDLVGFKFSAASPSAVIRGGKDLSSSSYGSVAEDIESATRTCPTIGTNCYSIGPYEKDN